MRNARIAVEGCGHGTLKAIYASVVKSCEAKGWSSVDLVIIGGDFQVGKMLEPRSMLLLTHSPGGPQLAGPKLYGSSDEVS